MADHVALAFTDEALHVDGERYLDCEFNGCRLIYAGGEVPFFGGCHLHDCNWHLEGAADNTINLLRMLVGMGHPETVAVVLGALGINATVEREEP
jgi:hypothetical protein